MQGEKIPPTAAYDIPEFCAAHNISRAFFYKLIKSGRGPTLIKIGRRTLISKESAARWRARLDAQSEA